MHTLYVVSVTLHILAAAAWIGGMIFFGAVVIPVLRQRDFSPVYAKMLAAAGARFRVLGWICVATLIATGVTNLAVRGIRIADLGDSFFWRSPFGSALAIKLAVVTTMIAITVLHDTVFGGRVFARAGADRNPARAAAFRRAASWIGRAMLLLSLVAAWLGVVLVRGWP